MTSPPYWGLRDYGVEGQFGLESSPEEYISKLVSVFREVRRVLRRDGTLWINIGDTYAGYWGDRKAREENRRSSADTNGWTNGFHMNARPSFHCAFDQLQIKPKDLVGIPWMLAFALRSDGWWLRSDVIWSKPNPMPESVTDRPTKSHEYVFLLTKSDRYFYDAEAIKEIAVGGTPGNTKHKGKTAFENGDVHMRTKSGLTEMVAFARRNKRTVWTIAVEAFPEAHFAVFPTKLVEPCILAGTSEHGCCSKCGAPWRRIVQRGLSFRSGSGRSGNTPEGKYAGSGQAKSGDYDIRLGPVVTTATVGWKPPCKCEAERTPCTVLDLFNGAGTTGLVALRLGRQYIGIELNAEYVAMSERRVREDAPLFSQEARR
ncbi:site-specific DNA-methyltransferase [Granulicella sp. S156]|uniref:DNA-methyltransferase n=1 Tax=Granulicella sp. S156 TaxID=1747224 RepID=UPI001C2079E9|nr:site-specific DNA-methyltransferase [Granulicella sp. S156]